MKPWKVYFEGSIWGHRGRDHAGREITVGKSFSWGNQIWTVPAVYVCARGLVLDICVSAEAEEMRAFVEKWLPYERMGDVPEEVREEMERQHPLRMEGKAELLCGRHRLRQKRASGSGWLPESCAVEGYRNGSEAEAFMSHYGLDRERAWAFRRVMFPWTTKRKPRQVRELTLCMEDGKMSYSGPYFSGQEEKVTFPHPITGKEYTLTILGVEERELPEVYFQREDLEYPRRCVTLGYTVTPHHEGVQVRWCGKGDAPRGKEEGGKAAGAHAVGVILQKKSGEQQAASALYFTLPEKREWRVIMMEKAREDVKWRIFGEEK